MITMIFPECLWSVSSHSTLTLSLLECVAVQCPGNNNSHKNYHLSAAIHCTSIILYPQSNCTAHTIPTLQAGLERLQNLLMFTELWVAEPATKARQDCFPTSRSNCQKTNTPWARLGQQNSLLVTLSLSQDSYLQAQPLLCSSPGHSRRPPNFLLKYVHGKNKVSILKLSQVKQREQKVP